MMWKKMSHWLSERCMCIEVIERKGKGGVLIGGLGD